MANNMANNTSMNTINCQYSTRYCWEADKVKSLIRLRAELSPLFTGKRNASKYAWAVVERELNVPLPLSKIIKKWNNLLQEYKAIKMSEEPKRREWPFFTLMDVYFSDQVNDPSLRLFSSTKTLTESIDDSVIDDDPIVSAAIAAATSGALMDIEELIKRQKEQKYQMDIKPYMDSSLPMSNNTCDDVDDRTHMMNKKFSDMKNVSPKHNVINDHFMAQQTKSITDENNKRQIQQTEQIASAKIGNALHIEQQQLLLQQNQNAQQQGGNYIDQNTIDQYLLSWNNFHGNMCRGFHSLQKDEKMVDVTIAAGGKIFKAHKLVLSVCSPYFQQIFLENPSSHPIFIMADVESNHMAGLLDFMYSGQVNVKYDDLPVFLKVAEAMKIKGLHTEKSNESEDNSYSSRETPQNTENSDLTAKYQQRAHNDSSPQPSCSSPSVKIVSQSNVMGSQNQQQQHQNQMISGHLKAKSIFAENFAKNLCKPSNGNNSFNKPSTPESSSDILNTSNCNKILDTRKHSKYFSKRKMYMHFNQTQQDNMHHIEEKRAKQQCMAQPGIATINNNLKSMLSENNEALNLVQSSTTNNDESGSNVVNSSQDIENKNQPTNLSCKDKRDTVLLHSLNSDSIKSEENRPIYSDPHKSFYHQPHQMKVEPEEISDSNNNNNNTKTINFNSNSIKSSSFYSDDNNNNNTDKVSCNSLDLKDKNNNRQEGINVSSKCDQYNGSKF